MVRIETTRFGVLEAAEERVVDFPAGLPGFAHVRRYALVGEGPLRWLQAVDDPAVAFIVADPAAMGGVRPPLPGPDVLRFIGVERDGDLDLLVIVRLDGDEIVPNLKGPLAINRARRVGAQAVLDKTQP